MLNRIRRLAALGLALLLLLPGLSLAEGEAVTEKDGWHFDEKGFLAGEDNPGSEYILEDEKNGVWQYASGDLSVRVTRYEEKTKKKKKQIYCVAEIRCSPESPLGVIMTEPYARYGKNLQPGKRRAGGLGRYVRPADPGNQQAEDEV